MSNDQPDTPQPRAHDEEIAQIFDAAGPLATAVPSYRSRPSQTNMAAEIAHTIAHNQTLIAEAGTGTGKTFAYLVPAMLWGGKVILSTGTKNLQDQLFQRDIPTVRQALNAPVSIALLKGRSNYVCPFHLERTLENGRLTSRDDVGYLRAISRFAQTTQSGDKSELSSVPENALIWNLVTSTRDTCQGAECGHYQDCFVMKARREAQQADVVVVNHHLFFADVALKESGVAELLPSANTIIFDEAHQLPDTASLFFGESASTSQIMELCRDVLAEGLTHARDGAKWAEVISPVEKAARDLRLTFPQDFVRLAVNQIAPDSNFFPALGNLREKLTELTAILDNQAERAETIEQCRNRTVLLGEALDRWQTSVNHEEAAAENVLWVETFSSSLHLHQTPLSIAPLFDKQREGSPRAWIFTSATLAVKNNFHHFASQMGLLEEPAQTWPSPFDYEQQALLYAPQNMPPPNSSGYTDAVVDAALPVIEAAGGRTFMLCTTLRAVKQIANRLRDDFAKRKLPFTILEQGEGSRTELLDRFRNSGNAVLVGSQSFWEGVDVRGDALSAVIIDRLPFAPPDDPVLAARISAMEKNGLNGFMDHQLPEAIISLKQGTGRLIRDESDRGVLMICDPRLITSRYGKRIWQSLPPFSRTKELGVARAFFEENPAHSEELPF